MLTIASYGGGTNSTAMLIGCYEKGEEVRLITFADPGGEMPKTYQYLETFNTWLIQHGMPEIVVVKKVDYKGDVLTLEENCLQQRMLPSIAYGFKTCSQKYKAAPQDKFVNSWTPAKEVWAKGEQIIKLIGYDAGEPQRAKSFSDKKYIARYPLIEWDWWRSDCVDAIKRHGLPLPGKSSCFFCPSMKKHEVLDLQQNHPDLLERALRMESNAELLSIKGLGRSYAWKALVDSHDHINMFCDVIDDMPCGCYDG